MLGFDELFRRTDGIRPMIPLAVAGASDETVLEALAETTRRGWTEPILCGNEQTIRTLADSIGVSIEGMHVVHSQSPGVDAVQHVRSGKARLLMKGQIATPDLMRAVLNAENGLRTGRTICQIVLMEIPRDGRRFLLSDTGITIQPTIEQLFEITQSTARIAQSLDSQHPRIAMMAATEKVIDAMPETRHAEELTQLIAQSDRDGVQFSVDGPLSFDLAYCSGAGQKKQIAGKAVGLADAMIFPNLLSANLTVKAIMYSADCRFGGVLAGAACPVVFMSRADDAATRVRSVALAISQLSNG